MASAQTSAQRIALALLGAGEGRVLTASMMVGAARLLGLTDNAMRIALTRLVQRGDVVLRTRGHYSLAERRRGAFEHVRSYRTGFARRVAWGGGFVGVLTADLSRRNAAAVARREAALTLVGFRPFTHGLYVRPDNLEGGPAGASAHLYRLGLDAEAEVVGITLAIDQAARALSLYRVDDDAAQAVALTRRIEALMTDLPLTEAKRFAADAFFLGDEVLRFLARDPLLPVEFADPTARRALAEAMERLDRHARALWNELLDELESAEVAA